MLSCSEGGGYAFEIVLVIAMYYYRDDEIGLLEEVLD